MFNEENKICIFTGEICHRNWLFFFNLLFPSHYCHFVCHRVKTRSLYTVGFGLLDLNVFISCSDLKIEIHNMIWDGQSRNKEL